MQLATVQDLANYWATDYDWRRCEAQLNTLPQFKTEIDGLDIHFIHVKSNQQNALPLIVSHGSIIEQLKIIEPDLGSLTVSLVSLAPYRSVRRRCQPRGRPRTSAGRGLPRCGCRAR